MYAVSMRMQGKARISGERVIEALSANTGTTEGNARTASFSAAVLLWWS